MEDSTRVFLAEKVKERLNDTGALLDVLRENTPNDENSMSFITDVSDHLYEARDSAGSLINSLKKVMEDNDA